MLIFDTAYFIIAIIVFAVSAAFLIKSLSRISHIAGMSEFTAALIIMAFATATPELFVGVSSALSGAPALSLGNLIGSSMLHLTLLIGIFTVIGKGIAIKNSEVGRDMYFVLASIVLLTVLFFVGNSLSRTDGAILLAFFVFSYCSMLRRKRGKLKKAWKHSARRISALSAATIFIISLAFLLISARYVSNYASLVATKIGVPQIVIGLFLISFSTTVPEFVLGLEAMKMRHKSMVLGDLLGGIIMDLGLVAGIVALIQPIEAATVPFAVSSVFMIASVITLAAFIKSRKILTIKEGTCLAFLYVLFIIAEIFIKL